MKAIITTALLGALIGSLFGYAVPAHATVLCQSVSDPTFSAYFPGFLCPAGYIIIG